MQPPIGAPGAMPQGHAIATHAERGKSWMLPEAKTEDLLYASQKERTLYAFQGEPDGANPNYLIAAGGTLYGTTALGGTKNMEPSLI
jgi:hypothetical protein